MGRPDNPRLRRRVPQQQRAKATVDRVLDAAAAILEEEGWDSLTTNAVAARAGVGIPTVYDYFPHKYALVHEIFRRNEAQVAEQVLPLIEQIGGEGDWRVIVEQVLRRTAALRAGQPGGAVLQGAFLSIPDLQEVRQESMAGVAAVLAEALQRLAPDLSEAEALRQAEVLQASVSAMVDASVRGRQVDERMLDDAVAMALTAVEGMARGSRTMPSVAG